MSQRRGLVGTKIADRYIITGEIGTGGMGMVFRAMPFSDPSQDVAIKIISRRQSLDSEDLMRFQKEAALMSRLHHRNIIAFHELGILMGGGGGSELGGGYYIVMEIAVGKNLKESLAMDNRKDLAFFFEVALQVTAALDYTHGKNIIHRDIKPQNIVVGKNWREQKGINVKVLDFGVARLREVIGQSEGDRYMDVAGTPMYMAPEQTGLMNAPLDHRADLYSLGCVLYEVLAGRPPFTAKTRDKLMRQHVSADPEKLSAIRPDVPTSVEAIVHKLLAKNPDDRYQTAFGLYADLQRVRAKLASREKPVAETVVLGLNDSFRAVSANLPLVGRDNEFHKVVESYQAITTDSGRSRLTVLRGSAGSGKTRLLTEFRSYLTKRRIRFVSTSFSRHENNLPFNALANGFNEYLIRVLKSQSQEAEEVRRKVRTLLGPLAHKVAQVVPGLKPYIDTDLENPSEQVPDAEFADEKNTGFDFATFAKAFSDFTRCLTPVNEPVVFIFDDMHWADEQSIQLIDQFFSHNNSQRFLMVVSYRPNVVNESPSFAKFVEKFRTLRRRFSEIDLSPLSEQSVRDLATNMLDSAASVHPSLVTYLYEKTAGNAMHVVELLRALVAQEYISFNPETRVWEYQIDRIRQSRVLLDSIDLTLSRLQTYDQGSRDVLAVASVCGMSFPGNLLKVAGDLNDMIIASALVKATEDGLISVSAEENEIQGLGENYLFTHRQVREAIIDSVDATRKRTLHRAIALRLEQAVAQPTPKTIFTVAHHINQAIGDGKDIEVEFAQRSVRPNINAGRVAMTAESWQAAQHYFENARLLLAALPPSPPRDEAAYFVMEHLADIAINQGDNPLAIQLFQSLVSQPIAPGSLCSASYKLGLLKLLGGQLSDVMKDLGMALMKMRMPWQRRSLTGFMGIWIDVFWDLLPEFLGNSPRRVLRHVRQQLEIRGDRPAPASGRTPIDLMGLGMMAKLREDPWQSLTIHQSMYKAVCQGRATIDNALRVLVDRAVLLAFLGFTKTAYRLFDEVFAVVTAHRSDSLMGYLVLQRTISIDSYRNKIDEQEKNLDHCLELFHRNRDRLEYATTNLARMSGDLFQLNFKRLEETARVVPNLVSTRSWISPRSLSIYLISLFLQDLREPLVKVGGAYLKRRAEVGARATEIFAILIQTLVAYCRGEMDRCRNSYFLMIKEMSFGIEKEWLWPFEVDVLLFFALAFPEVYGHEQSRDLLTTEEHRNVLAMLQRLAAHPNHRMRAMSQLIEAYRVGLRKAAKAKKLYDQALSAARLSNESLVTIFAYYFFGRYLLRQGVEKRADYIQLVHKEAAAKRLNVVVSMAEKVMRSRAIAFEPVNMPERKPDRREGPQYKMSGFVYEHLKHIADVLALDTALDGHVHESMAILARYYQFSRATVIVASSAEETYEVAYPLDVGEHGLQVRDYTAPYVNIRSTLFVPVSDAPWYQRREGERDGGDPSGSAIATLRMSQQSSLTPRRPYPPVEVPKEEDLGKTDIVDPAISQDGSKSSERQPPGERRASDRGQSRSYMNALIPIPGSRGNIGLVMLEKMKMTNEQGANLRQDLDQFAAQLGVLIERKTDSEFIRSRAVPETYLHEPGTYQLEPVPWMTLWTHGRLRREREAAWYLGMNLNEHEYLLVYCRLNGLAEIRARLSPQIWWHLQTVRSLVRANAHQGLTPFEIKEELASLLKKDAGAGALETISISFTIFDKTQKTAWSGHFGPSRPMVLLTENEVTPFSEPMLHFTNNRLLRYWEVKATLEMMHIYILPHDSSKLDGISLESLEKSVVSFVSAKSASANLYRMLDRLMLREHLPRYYVAGVLTELISEQRDRYELPKAQ